ncbi:hypothetical protein IG631_12874 [Alternaria alternata]|nr:hypothetical protein IG631_12874 [Alternaria alternata]
MPGYCVAMWSYRPFGHRHEHPICRPEHRWSLNVIIRRAAELYHVETMRQAMYRLFAQVARAFQK